MFAAFDRWRTDARALTSGDAVTIHRHFFPTRSYHCDGKVCDQCQLVHGDNCVLAHCFAPGCGFCQPTLSVLFELEAYKRISGGLAALTDAMCDDAEALEWLTAIVGIDLSVVALRWTRWEYSDIPDIFVMQTSEDAARHDKRAETAARKALTACKKLQARITQHFAPGGPVESALSARFEQGALDQLLRRADTDDGAVRRAALDELKAKLAPEPSKKRKKSAT